MRQMRQNSPVIRGLAAALVAVVAAPLVATAEEKPKADRPEIVGLEVFPESLTLQDVRDARRILVTGRTKNGADYDLTHQAVLKSDGPQVRITEAGYIAPAETGETTVSISAAGQTAEIPVRVQDVSDKPVSFVRDVMPILSKVGCNAGTCHGAADGQNGFKLSLRGYDPPFDYRSLIDDISGRRFNRSMPSQSLMLLKPTQGVPHEGGFLFDEDSRYYRLIHQWIAEGCGYNDAGRVDRIEVFPKKPLLQRPGHRQQLVVLAHYPDGLVRDVTRDAVFESTNFEAASVDESGLIEAVRRGESAVVVRYEGKFATARVAILGDREGYEWKESPEFNYVDKHVNAKLRRMKILPSDLCTDAEFLRRISLDLTGLPPRPEEVRAFVADPRDSQAKRQAKVEELLNSPEFVNFWTMKWSDLLLVNREFLTEKGTWAFRNWISHSIATNKPYDRFVYELMTAKGSTFDNPAANYYRVAREPNEVMENMTQVFLGTRFNCNKCHDHPFERWTQDQYYMLSAFFAGVGRKKGPGRGEEIVFTRSTPERLTQPSTGQAASPEFPYEFTGLQNELQGAETRRDQLARWLTSPDNPYFAMSAVNRYWSYFFNRGIIAPVDDIRSSNPPSNPELLNALTEDFVQSGFDIKSLIRTIVSSHTYQRSYQTNRFNEADEINFSHSVPRRLKAEQLYDALMTATGSPSGLPGVPADFRATQLPDPNVKVPFLDMFGRPPRESPCECERSTKVSLKQTLALVNGPQVHSALTHPEGRIAKLIAENASRDELIEEIYLAVLCRYPTETEAAYAEGYFAGVGEKTQAAEDLMWSLINSPAFLFNR